jgi:hypothetical protein
MTENIYVRVEGGLVFNGTKRVDGKRYSDIGKEPDGTQKLREWDDAENAARDAEEAAWAARVERPPAKTLEQRIADLEAKVDVSR